MADIRMRLINENPDNTLLRRNTYSPPESIRGTFVFIKIRKVVNRARVITVMNPKTIGSEDGGTEKKIKTANAHKISGRNRYCNFICDLL
jgi:hypothetical protein